MPPGERPRNRSPLAELWQRRELLGPRLLLGDAMIRAQAPGQLFGRQPADLPIRKELRQGVDGCRIGRVCELRHDHHAIGDVEVRVANRQSRRFKVVGPGMGSLMTSSGRPSSLVDVRSRSRLSRSVP